MVCRRSGRSYLRCCEIEAGECSVLVKEASHGSGIGEEARHIAACRERAQKLPLRAVHGGVPAKSVLQLLHIDPTLLPTISRDLYHLNVNEHQLLMAIFMHIYT